MSDSSKVAIVTGGSRGIGREICLTLARRGADIVVADIREDMSMETVKLVEELGRRAIFVRTDISAEDDVKQLFATTLEEFGCVDILVNNAGLCRMIPILDIEVTEWDKIMAVNLRGTFLASREALRIMIDRGAGGKIVNMGSAAAKTGGAAAGAHYSASKAGVVCFTKSLALQAAPYKINVNAVCPGPISTEMTDEWGKENNEALAKKIPWKEFGSPQDVANAVAFLVSDEARYITGEMLDVNGGLVMD